jgi:catechol 2,3-dioxygenase-like lactoylglutathione lyase family enzyme
MEAVTRQERGGVRTASTTLAVFSVVVDVTRVAPYSPHFWARLAALTAWPSVDTRDQEAYQYRMKIIKLAWVGTRTENFQQTADFFRDLLGLRSELDRPGFRVLTLPDGSKVEVFGPDSDMNRHFTTGPVAGFLVDDVRAVADELRSSGVEILHAEEDESGNAWVHFRAPDGNIYEFTQDPGVSRPQ